MPFARARGRGSKPMVFTESQTTQYSRRSRTVREFRGSTIDVQGMGPGLRPGWAGQRPAPTSDLLAFGCFGPLGQRVQEGVCGLRRFDISFQRCLERDHAAVEIPRAVLVFLDDGAGELQAGKGAAGPRV